MSLHSEILEQSQIIRNLFFNQRKIVEEVAKEIHQKSIPFVFLAARGTSDNAGRYANYLLGIENGLVVAPATPSLFTYYQSRLNLNNALVIGISQSGQSPDVVSVLAEGKKQNSLTVAITNDPNSPLGITSDFVLDLQAGHEGAVAATKTYTAELMIIAMLSAALRGDTRAWAELEQVSSWMDQILKLDSYIDDIAQRYRYMQQCVVIGRGYNYSTAFEWALKLKELTYIGAEAYSSADFMHGPIAIVNGGFPILAVSPTGMVNSSMFDTLFQLKNGLDAELVVISNDSKTLALADIAIEIPLEVPEWLSPIVSIVAGQLFAYHLTCLKGLNPEQPRIIRKVTETI
jgi:glucosamine--fructose-6-phosphate aminotransferase (isomerizing)